MKEVKKNSFLGYMNGKKLIINNDSELQRFISGLTGEVMITIEEIKNRTQYQNKYYWRILRWLSKQHPFDGYTAEELHDAMKQTFDIISTKELDKEQFSEYIDKITRLANENDVQVPTDSSEDDIF